MNHPVKQTLHWTPRILGILFVLFLSIFALDVFDEGQGFWKTLLALLMHLIPSIVLAIVVALAWRWEWIGFLAFAGWSIFYIATVQNFPISVYLIIAGIPFLIGTLFLVDWIYRKQLHPA